MTVNLRDRGWEGGRFLKSSTREFIPTYSTHRSIENFYFAVAMMQPTNDASAPNPVVRGVALGLPGSTLSGPSSRYRETAVRVESGLDGGDAP
jgi:hypothetical protein